MLAAMATRVSSRSGQAAKWTVPPVLVRQIRNGVTEAVHRGDVAEADAAAARWRLRGAANVVDGRDPAGASASAVAAMARQALASFVRQPGTLEISLRPPKPVGMTELGARFGSDPAAAIQQLGLTVVAR